MLLHVKLWSDTQPTIATQHSPNNYRSRGVHTQVGAGDSEQLNMASNGAEGCEGSRKPEIQLRRSRSAVGSRTESRSANKISSAVKIRERRVKSALESRREQEASAVFPEEKADPKWGVTKYSEDYCPKKRSTPVPVRPASPTRMNNPHPAQVRIYTVNPNMIAHLGLRNK